MADITSGQMTWNGIPLLIPDEHGQLEQWLSQYQSIREIIEFCTTESAQISSINAPQSIAGTGITSLNYTDPPELKLNSLYWPTNAARFGYFVGLLPSNAEGVGTAGSEGTLLLSDGTNSLSVKMNILAFRPVTALPNLGLIVLVDKRYNWQFFDCGNIILNTGWPMLDNGEITGTQYDGTPNNDYGQYEIGWAEVFSSLETVMGVSFDRDTVDGYESCDVLELTNRKFFNAAVMLDAVCDSVGMRCWVDFDGTVKIKKSTTGYADNFNNQENLIAGNFTDGTQQKPGSIIINYPRATWYHSYCDGDVYSYESNIGDGPGRLTVDSTFYAHWTEAPDNYSNYPVNLTKLLSLSANIRQGIMGWWGQDYDATWQGIKNWSISGFDNFITINFSIQIPNDQYYLSIDADNLPKDDTKFNLNYFAFNTRVQSMPKNFGTRINLSQDARIRFLRGMQWGKLSEDYIPPVEPSDPEEEAPPIAPIKIRIWQFDSDGKEIDTKIEIQAYDVSAQSSTIPKDSLVMLDWHCVNRRWLWEPIQAGQVNVVQVSPDADLSNTSGYVQRNTSCVWEGQVIDIGTKYTFCTGNNFLPNKRIWIACFNTNQSDGMTSANTITQLPKNERYLAKLVGSFSVGEDSRPLYVIKHVESTTVNVVRITGEQNQQIAANNYCVWPGKLLKMVEFDYPMCNDQPWENDTDIWIATLESNNAVTIRNLPGNTKYLGRLMGSYDVAGVKRPLYVIQTKTTGNVNVVKVVDTSPGPIGNMSRKNSSCLWPGKIVKTNTDAQICGNYIYQPNLQCWIIICNNDGEIIDYLPNQDQYIGLEAGQYKLGGGDLLPLYVVKEAHHLIRFQLLLPLYCGVAPPPNNATQLLFNTDIGDYSPVGNLISVVDPYQQTGGIFEGVQANPFATGYRGYAEWKPDRKIYEIIYMDGPAQWIKFRLTSGRSLGLNDSFVRCAVMDYWGGRNPDPDNEGLSVYNLTNFNNTKGVFAAPSDAVGLAVYDDFANQYNIVYIQGRMPYVIGKLTTNLSTDDGTATGSVTYAWGNQNAITPSSVSLVDKTDPFVFTGAINDQFHATWDADLDKYVLTWVQCQTASTGP